ncbi:hypothetical protein HRbin16_00081 [bacterium HR16]|nr:hypothetical protein HRbin16_00081 [bacterium HR16]
MTNSPFTLPMRTAPTGPLNGMFETVNAADAPMMESTSGRCSLSTDRGIAITCTSLRIPLGNSGRKGRSIRRAVSTALSLGRPPRLMNPPGILPTEYLRSS